MIRYFKRADGGFSQVNEETNPSYASECASNCKDIYDEKGKLQFKATWKELTKEEYDKATYIPEPVIKPTYEQLVQDKLIAKGYDINRQIAIICNKDRDDEHMKEFEEMQKVRKECKAAAKKEI